jgi:hypothetical protein
MNKDDNIITDQMKEIAVRIINQFTKKSAIDKSYFDNCPYGDSIKLKKWSDVLSNDNGIINEFEIFNNRIEVFIHRRLYSSPMNLNPFLDAEKQFKYEVKLSKKFNIDLFLDDFLSKQKEVKDFIITSYRKKREVKCPQCGCEFLIAK